MTEQEHLKRLIESKVRNHLYANDDGDIMNTEEFIKDLSEKILYEKDKFAMNAVDWFTRNAVPDYFNPAIEEMMYKIDGESHSQSESFDLYKQSLTDKTQEK